MSLCSLDLLKRAEHVDSMKHSSGLSTKQVAKPATLFGLASFLGLSISFVIGLGAISAPFNIQAQGLSLGGAQSLSPQDLNALKSSMGMGGLGLGASSGGGNFFSSGLSGPALLALPANINDEEPADSSKKEPAKKITPLPPNEFQKYVLEVTGRAYPLYGADFFENSRYAMQQQQSPVGDDYVLGAGDQLLIRVGQHQRRDASHHRQKR